MENVHVSENCIHTFQARKTFVAFRGMQTLECCLFLPLLSLEGKLLSLVHHLPAWSRWVTVDAGRSLSYSRIVSPCGCCALSEKSQQMLTVLGLFHHNTHGSCIHVTALVLWLRIKLIWSCILEAGNIVGLAQRQLFGEQGAIIFLRINRNYKAKL